MRETDFAPFKSEVASLYSPSGNLDQKCTNATSAPLCAFNIYCANGKQKKALKTSFQGVIGQAPAGISIESAAQARQNAISSLRSIVNDYYQWGLPEPHTSRSHRYNENLLYKAKYVHGLPFKDAPSWTRYLKDTRIAVSSLNHEQIDASPIFVTQGDGASIVVGLVETPAYDVERGTANDDYMLVRSTGALADRKEAIFGIPSDKAIDVWTAGHLVSAGQGYKMRREKTGEKVHPLRLVAPLEPATFWANYTMLIPAATQKNIFANRAAENDSDDQEEFEPFFVRKDGTFDLQEALSERTRIWREYIRKFTAIKEAQTKDPQIINFEASLDLAAFCAYARPITDLTTR